MLVRHHDTQHNDIGHNDTQQTTLSKKGFFATFSITTFSIMTLSITMLCHYAECCILFTIMLNEVMLSFVILNEVMLSFGMLIVVAPVNACNYLAKFKKPISCNRSVIMIVYMKENGDRKSQNFDLARRSSPMKC